MLKKFKSLFSKAPTPVQRPEPKLLDDVLYNCLFADRKSDFQTMCDHNSVKWIFGNNAVSSEELSQIIKSDDLESRIKFLCCKEALMRGVKIELKEYLGTIIEMPMGGGYDILAFYSDGSARYYNYSGAAVIYENGSKIIDDSINRGHLVSREVISHLGPWNSERLARPTDDLVRFTFLVSDGLYFGQGPIEIMNGDEMGRAIMSSGAIVMKSLIEASSSQEKDKQRI